MSLRDIHPGWWTLVGVLAWAFAEYFYAAHEELLFMPFIVALCTCGYTIEELFRDLALGNELHTYAVPLIAIAVLLIAVILIRFVDLYFRIFL